MMRWLLAFQLLFAVAAVAVGWGELPPTLSDYRLTQAELAIEQMRVEHDKLVWLLIGNLVAVIAGIVTYLVTHRRGGDD